MNETVSQRNINIFRETFKLSREIGYVNSIVYHENFISQKTRIIKNNTKSNIIIEDAYTLDSAYFQGIKDKKKTAVLNFANPVNPGGGVTIGASAQEEYLCRCTNLYLSLISDDIDFDYYKYNKKFDYIFSDRIIYSKDITVFKNRDTDDIKHKRDWFCLDVITCAAPYLKNRYINKIVLKDIFKSRIKNIFESAIDNSIDVIILGAFGCGAFKNPAAVVSCAFKEVIDENNYNLCFDKIVFAIKNFSKDNSFCENLAEFERRFYETSQEMNKLRFEPYYGYNPIDTPYDITIKDIDKIDEFIEWQKNNKYYNKEFSIIGDSISTLSGYNPKGYKIFYSDEIHNKSAIYNMDDTWWGRLINMLGGELLVNNSWSGSMVTCNENSILLFPSGCSEERTSNLHINKVNPDVILVHIGTNDWCRNVKLENCNPNMGFNNMDKCSEFNYAYGKMIYNIKNNYPNSEIWCCTIAKTYISTDSSFIFPGNHIGKDIEYFNNAIRQIAIDYKCNIMDFAKFDNPYDSFDGIHPNANGMKNICIMALKSLLKDGYSDFEKMIKNNIDYQEINTYENEMNRLDKGKLITLGQYKLNLLYSLDRKGIFPVYLCVEVEKNVLYNLEIVDTELSNHLIKTVENSVINSYKLFENITHDNLCQIIGIYRQSNICYILMENANGNSLEKHIKLFKPVDEKFAKGIALQIARVLAYLHSLHSPIIFRDIKPQNIILPYEYNQKRSVPIIKLVNYDIAMLYNPNLKDEHVLGTVGYAPIEQYNGYSVPASDIYSFGMTMIYILTGDNPKNINDNTFKILKRKVSGNFFKIINKCIEQDFDNRFKDGTELLDVLKKCK